ncbi:hypothetical protein MMC19_003248 [Ptychographa xylographoides]|nr:hypothetical protein [Ptychographa xylographoides]
MKSLADVRLHGLLHALHEIFIAGRQTRLQVADDVGVRDDVDKAVTPHPAAAQGRGVAEAFERDAGTVKGIDAGDDRAPRRVHKGKAGGDVEAHHCGAVGECLREADPRGLQRAAPESKGGVEIGI